MMGLTESPYHACQAVRGRRWCWNCLGLNNMFVKAHGCLSEGLIGFWLWTYLFTRMMGGQSDLPRTCVRNLMGGGVQRVPGWIFKKPTESSKIHNMRLCHGQVPLSRPKDVCMVWSLRRDGIILGG